VARKLFGRIHQAVKIRIVSQVCRTRGAEAPFGRINLVAGACVRDHIGLVVGHDDDVCGRGLGGCGGGACHINSDRGGCEGDLDLRMEEGLVFLIRFGGGEGGDGK
jgi:hypothetical protein